MEHRLAYTQAIEEATGCKVVDYAWATTLYMGFETKLDCSK